MSAFYSRFKIIFEDNKYQNIAEDMIYWLKVKHHHFFHYQIVNVMLETVSILPKTITYPTRLPDRIADDFTKLQKKKTVTVSSFLAHNSNQTDLRQLFWSESTILKHQFNQGRHLIAVEVTQAREVPHCSWSGSTFSSFSSKFHPLKDTTHDFSIALKFNF